MHSIIQPIIRAFIPPAVVFCVHLMLIFGFDVYSHIPMIDVPMHFFGGLSIAVTATMLYRLCRAQDLIVELSFFFRIFLITCVVTWVAVLWEFAEFFSDVTFHTFMQASIRDSMADLALGMAGGLIGAILFRRR